MKSFLAKIRRSARSASSAAADPTTAAVGGGALSASSSWPSRSARKTIGSLPGRGWRDDGIHGEDVDDNGGATAADAIAAEAAAAAGGPLISRLPLELHIMIIAELLLLAAEVDHEDGAADAYLAVLQVCRAWRHIWLSEQIWRSLAEEWMPGYGEMMAMRLEKAETAGGTTREAAAGGGKGSGVPSLGRRQSPRHDDALGGRRGMEEEEEEDERSTAGVAARGSPDLRGGADEHFRRMLVARQRRRHGMFTTALHYGMRLADDQLFRVSLAVPTHEGGVHTVFKDDDDVDSDDDMDLDRLFRGNGGRSNGRSSFRPTDERERKSGRETASHSPRRKPATHFRFMMYNNGRVAWWPQAYARPYSAVVDDLRTGVRRMYDFPAHGLRQTGYTAAMSSELLLMGRGCVLHAWHLRLDRLQTATFPRAIERVFVEADRVVAVARNSDVFYWRYGEEEEEAGCCWRALDMGDDDVDDYGGRGLGGCFARGRVRMSGLVELPPTSPPHRMGLRLCEDGMLLDFILHPVVMDTLFVVTFSTDHRLCVHEIRDVGRGGRRFATYQPQSDDMTVFEDLSEHGYLRWEKIDSHGGYCLMMVNGEETRWARHRDGGHNLAHAHEQGHDHEDDSAQPGSPCAQPDAAYTVVAICFNIYTREFDFVVYHPPWHFATSWHLWNGLLFTPDGKTGRDLVIASRRCSHHSTTHTYSSDEDTSSARGPEGPRIPTSPAIRYYTTTEETQVNSRDHATSHPKEDRPVFARRRRFAMSHADQQSILADSQLPGAASVIEHIAHVLDTSQTYSPSEPLPGITGLPDRSTGGSRENVPLQHRKQRILGDDGLLVFVDDQDYTVWGFGLDLVAEKGNDGIHDGASGRGRGGRGKGKGNQSRSASMARILPWIKK